MNSAYVLWNLKEAAEDPGRRRQHRPLVSLPTDAPTMLTLQYGAPIHTPGDASRAMQRAEEAVMDSGAGYAVGWFTLALINAGLAQGKGRSGLAWALVSLILGPIATFLIVVLPGT